MLFDKLGLPVIKKTKTGYSTDAEVLERLEPYHEIVGHILHYRQLTKLQSTYIEGLLKEIRPETGKVHTYYRQTIAATGRLSSQFPNLQNIPIRLEEGRQIRKAFVPSEPGWYMLAADYSQIELRVLAHISGDERLKEAFRDDMDIHTKTAMDVFGVATERSGRQYAPAGEGGQFRHRLRHQRLRPVAKPGHSAQGGGGVHRAIFQRVPGRAPVYGRHRAAGAARTVM